MSQISKVEREHDIKQVSRSDDLKPATEKTISKSIPRIPNKASSKELTEITEQKETTVSMPMTAPIKAARRAGIAAIRHAIYSELTSLTSFLTSNGQIDTDSCSQFWFIGILSNMKNSDI